MRVKPELLQLTEHLSGTDTNRELQPQFNGIIMVVVIFSESFLW